MLEPTIVVFAIVVLPTFTIGVFAVAVLLIFAIVSFTIAELLIFIRVLLVGAVLPAGAFIIAELRTLAIGAVTIIGVSRSALL